MSKARREPTPRRKSGKVNRFNINLIGTGDFHEDYNRGQTIGLQLLDHIAHHTHVYRSAPTGFAFELLKAAARARNSTNVLDGVLVSLIRAISQTVTFDAIAAIRKEDAEHERYYREACERDRALREREKAQKAGAA